MNFITSSFRRIVRILTILKISTIFSTNLLIYRSISNRTLLLIRIYHYNYNKHSLSKHQMLFRNSLLFLIIKMFHLSNLLVYSHNYLIYLLNYSHRLLKNLILLLLISNNLFKFNNNKIIYKKIIINNSCRFNFNLKN
jgi:hypothetical protein